MQRIRGIIVFAALLVGIAQILQTHALTDEEIFRQLRFNFINPGARALALGGSFIALADDATAANANPAGLTQLAAPEFFAEMRHTGGDTTFQSSAPTAFPNTSSRNERRPVTAPTFLAYGYRFRNFAVAVSRQGVLDTDVSVATKLAFDFAPIVDIEWFGTGNATLRVVQWNASFAWKPNSWFSAGITGSLGQMHIHGAVNNTVRDPAGLFLCDYPNGPIHCDTNGDGLRNESAPVFLQSPQGWYYTRIDDDDSAITYSAGVLFTPIEKFAAGLVYRAGAKYTFQEEYQEQLLVYFSNALEPHTTSEHTLNLPSSYGVGFKYRPEPHWTITADAVRVNYSELLDGMASGINLISSLYRTFGASSWDYTVDDVTEVHLGAEYLFIGGRLPWAVRMGAYTDPDNAIRSSNAPSGVSDALAGRDSVIHYTAGIGIVAQQKFQADVAISYSSIGTELVSSFIYRF